jgi:uncharacterized membrane protein YbhN (UPF0104 family)
MRMAAVLRHLRPAIGVLGLAALALIVRAVGVAAVARTLRDATSWLPILCLLEGGQIVAEAAASYFAFGSLADRLPLATLLRAHVLGHAIGAIAPAPTVFNETIKATLLAPFVGAPAAASVGVTNQAATLIAGGLFSIPCAIAIFLLQGPSLWFWACAAHAVVLTACGVCLRAVTRAGAARRWFGSRFPRLAARTRAFHAHGIETGFFAARPTGALLVKRGLQALQYGVAARAVGADATFLHALAAQGVNLVASAVGVLVPGGLGTTDGAFTLAAGLLGVTAARATSLALLMRSVQLIWLLIASVMALLVTLRERAPTKPSP